MADNEKLAFHRKYRPKNLSSYIGNAKMKETALKALNSSTKPQVILLYGDSGCGKTTFARLLEKEYLCENRDSINGACNQCNTCLEIDDYIQTGNTDMLMNIKEINIADQSGKKDLNGVLEEMMIPSYGDEWKIFMFDECHMATPQAQNMMLKIAEEPPENVLMIFCTTNPEMMLETLKNRCQLQLQVKKPTVAELSSLLKSICKREDIEFDIKGLNFIANRSNLTIRRALTSLEQVINEQGKVKYENVVSVFEEVSDTLIVDFYKKLVGKPEYNKDGSLKRTSTGSVVRKRDIVGYVGLIGKITGNTDLKTFVSTLIDFTIKGIYTINNVVLDGVSDGELSIYRELFSDFTVEQFAYLINKLITLGNSTYDIETNLLLLGYTGIVDRIDSPSGNEPTSMDSTIDSIKNELGLESHEANKNKAIKETEILSDNLAKADSMLKNASLDDIQAMFGGSSVIK